MVQRRCPAPSRRLVVKRDGKWVKQSNFLTRFPTERCHCVYRFLHPKGQELNGLECVSSVRSSFHGNYALLFTGSGPTASLASALLPRGRPNTHFRNGGATMPAQQPLDDVLQRVQGEYREMPGLRLTTAQAQRLWGLDRAACDALLGALVDAKFLLRTRDGAFMRSDQALAART